MYLSNESWQPSAVFLVGLHFVYANIDKLRDNSTTIGDLLYISNLSTKQLVVCIWIVWYSRVFFLLQYCYTIVIGVILNTQLHYRQLQDGWDN